MHDLPVKRAGPADSPLKGPVMRKTFMMSLSSMLIRLHYQGVTLQARAVVKSMPLFTFLKTLYQYVKLYQHINTICVDKCVCCVTRNWVVRHNLWELYMNRQNTENYGLNHHHLPTTPCFLALKKLRPKQRMCRRHDNPTTTDVWAPF